MCYVDIYYVPASPGALAVQVKYFDTSKFLRINEYESSQQLTLNF